MSSYASTSSSSSSPEVRNLFRDLVEHFTRVAEGAETIYGIWTKRVAERITLHNIDEILDLVFSATVSETTPYTEKTKSEKTVSEEGTEVHKKKGGKTWKRELLDFLFSNTFPYSPWRHLRQIPRHLLRYYAETGDERCYEEMNTLKNTAVFDFYKEIGRRCDTMALDYYEGFSPYFFTYIFAGIETSKRPLSERKRMLDLLRENGMGNEKLRAICDGFRYRMEKLMPGSEDSKALLAYMESLLPREEE